ncbi:MAG TPA: LamG domain-containing protein, partial [Verrucomicrobiae bacterium]|nr:LamG domain-containing protein [Verrucomicrobiae bacterium]
EDEYNYGIDASVTILDVGLLPSLKAVVLTTTPFVPSAGPYALTVDAIVDRAPARNVMGSVTVPLQLSFLVARYGFDDFRDLGADSAGGNDGAAVGGPTVVAGQSGRALNFDNIDDYVSVPYNRDLAITGDITLAAWIKRDSLSEYGGLIAKTDGANTWDFDLQFQNGQDTLALYSDTTGPSTIVSSNTVSDTAWHHIAFTRRGNLATFYIDGADAGTATLDGGFGLNQNPIRIGTDGPAWDPSSMFHGSMDDVRIYNRALTATEIQALMSRPRVSIAHSGSNVVISWPAAAMDFVLESTDNLASGNWSTVNESIIPSGDLNTVTVPVGSGSTFYRLKE